MAVKKVTLKEKTAAGYDDLHPKTELSQISDLSQLITRNNALDRASITGSDLILINDVSDALDKLKKTSLYDLNHFFSNYWGFIESIADLPPLTESTQATYEQIFYYVLETESFWYYTAEFGVWEWRNTDHKSDGINIVVSDEEPAGLEAGDFWYQVTE